MPVQTALMLPVGLGSACLGQTPVVDDASLGIAGGDLSPGNGTISIAENLGQTVGNNLFHSFSRFNVPANTTAAFQGSDSLQNVIARVTGVDASAIDGVIDTKSVMPSADFFLLNPNGIHFGAGASLSVGGSAAFSTADEFGFTDAKTFPAAIPVSDVLSSAPVNRIGLTSAQPKDITMTGSAIAIGNVLQTAFEPSVLSLVGGDVRLTGTFLEPTIMNIVAMGKKPTGASSLRNVRYNPTDFAGDRGCWWPAGGCEKPLSPPG